MFSQNIQYTKWSTYGTVNLVDPFEDFLVKLSKLLEKQWIAWGN